MLKSLLFIVYYDLFLIFHNETLNDGEIINIDD